MSRLLKTYRPKTREYHAADQMGKCLFAAGVPARYWNTTEESVSDPSPFVIEDRKGKKIEKVKVSAVLQKEWINYLSTVEGLESGNLVIVGSDPTEDWAMALGTYIAKHAIENKMTVEMVDVRHEAPPYPSPESIPQVLILHNMTADSTRGRIENCRDWIQLAEGALIVVCFTGSDPRFFVEEKLRIQADAEIYKKGRYRRRRVLKS